MEDDADDLIQQLRTNPTDLPHFNLGSFLSWNERCVRAQTTPEGNSDSDSTRLGGTHFKAATDAAVEALRREGADVRNIADIDPEFLSLVQTLESNIGRNRGVATTIGFVSPLSRPYSAGFNQKMEALSRDLKGIISVESRPPPEYTNTQQPEEQSTEDELEKLLSDLQSDLENATVADDAVNEPTRPSVDTLQAVDGSQSGEKEKEVVTNNEPREDEITEHAHDGAIVPAQETETGTETEHDTTPGRPPIDETDPPQTDASLDELLASLKNIAHDNRPAPHLRLDQTDSAALAEIDHILGTFQQIPDSFVLRPANAQPEASTQLPTMAQRLSTRGSTRTLQASQRIDALAPLVVATHIFQIIDSLSSSYKLPVPKRDYTPPQSAAPATEAGIPPAPTSTPSATGPEAPNEQRAPAEPTAEEGNLQTDESAAEVAPAPSVEEPPKPPFPSEPPRPPLREMLGDAPNCGCGEKVTQGQILTALGRGWHPDHFRCYVCSTTLLGVPFFPFENHPLCKEHFLEFSCPRCGGCGKTIEAQFVTAIDRKWHPECFCCYTCRGGLPGGQFFVMESLPTCQACYQDKMFPKCAKCKGPITSNIINALDQLWHAEHFVCTTCSQPFPGGTFFPGPNSQPYCQKCLYAATNSLCQTCGQPIEGRCITAGGKKYHLNHFVCTNCKDELTGVTCRERSGKPYCINCHTKLFD